MDVRVGVMEIQSKVMDSCHRMLRLLLLSSRERISLAAVRTRPPCVAVLAGGSGATPTLLLRRGGGMRCLVSHCGVGCGALRGGGRGRFVYD